MPPGVTTWISPVVAPEGTLVVICEGKTTVNVAGMPLKLTLVGLVRKTELVQDVVWPIWHR
jgi:hypothetical protein